MRFVYCALLAGFLGFWSLTVSAASKPNVIFILADDLGYGDLGCYGQRRVRTPNIDRLASEGVRFTSVYAGSTVCAPSRCALMTGLHTGHGRVRGNLNVPLAPEDFTLPELFKKAGYRTGGFGKWGLGNENTTGAASRKGFDEWFGFLDQTHAHNYYPTNLWRNETSVLLEKNLNNRKGTYAHDLFTTEALRFLDANEHQPFFLYLAYTIPHANNELKKEGMEVPDDRPYSGESWPKPEKNKAAMITRLDRDVGRILEKLRVLGLEEETLIFFASDNGPHKEGGSDPGFFQSSGPLRGIKRDMYEGGIRVPMMVRWTGHIKPGLVSDVPWAFWDVLPSMAVLLKEKAPRHLDGISMLPAMLGKRQKPHPFFYWEFHEKGSKQAVRMGDWKAVRLAPGAALELYDLGNDLGETRNVAPQNPKVIAKIERYLSTARTESPHWPFAAAK